MLSSTLRRARFHLQYNCHRRCAGGGPLALGITYTKNRPIIPNTCSRLINSRSVIEPIRTSGVVATSLPRHTLTSPMTTLVRNAYFSTEGEANPTKTNLLLNVDEELPEIYASPYAVAGELARQRGFSNTIMPLENGCKSIIINKDGRDEQWHTATYTNTKTEEYFHSGKFGGFMSKFGQNHQQSSVSLSSEETSIVDGRVYYRSENVAQEAAAARALDCLAFRSKYSKLTPSTTDESLEPLRYCVELPYMFPMFGGNNAFRMTRKHSHAPAYYWSCLMQAKHGPVDVKFDVQSMSFACEMADDTREETWYSATCFESKTGEAFESSVFGSSFPGSSLMPDAPTTPLPLEEIRTFGGMVYYRDESTAKHAAAARAIDCLNFRSFGNGSDGSKEKSKLCLEDPYLNDKKKTQPTDYEALKDIVEKRRRSESDPTHEETFTFSSYAKSFAYLLHVPKNFLHNGLQNGYGQDCRDSFDVQKTTHEDKKMFTATFSHPITNERFSSGLVGEINVEKRVNTSPATPLHLAQVKILDGKVYYRNAKLAKHAAAARAIDCYIFREETADTNKIQLCIEDPYKTVEEGTSQKIDYSALLAQRNPKKSVYILHKKEPTFSSYAKSTPHLIHAPKNFLYIVFEKCHGQDCKDSFHVQEMTHENKEIFTATFTDPITKEMFSSGLGGEINVEKRRSSSLATPLHLGKVKILDGKVYYSDRKLAEHAAAARAIDCYIFREGEETPNKLCLEEPYQSATERDAQQIDYVVLLKKRNSHVSKKKEFQFVKVKPSEGDPPALTFSFDDEPTKVNKSPTI